MQDKNRSGEGGRRACYVTRDLSYGYSTVRGRERKRKRDLKTNGMEKINKCISFCLRGQAPPLRH